MADLLLAVVRRTRAGRSPFAPDKQHLHHRLLEIGHSQRRAVFIMWLWAALVAFGTVVVSLYTGPLMWISLAAAAVVTIALTFVLPIVHKPHLPVTRTPEPASGGYGPPADLRAGRGRFRAAPDFVLLFTSTDQPTTGRPPTMTTARRRPRAGSPSVEGSWAVRSRGS